MSFKNIQSQLELSRKAISEMNKQNTIFETLLQEAIKGAPEEDKKEIDRIRSLTLKVQKLAKEGRIEEAQTLIKEHNYGGKNN